MRTMGLFIFLLSLRRWKIFGCNFPPYRFFRLCPVRLPSCFLITTICPPFRHCLTRSKIWGWLNPALLPCLRCLPFWKILVRPDLIACRYFLIAFVHLAVTTVLSPPCLQHFPIHCEV